MATIVASFSGGKFHIDHNGKKLSSASPRYIRNKFPNDNVVFGDEAAAAAPVASKYGINKRFGFVENLVSMVASGVQPSAVITGEGGLGKSFTVTKTLTAGGFVDMSSFADIADGSIMPKKRFIVIKGYSTPKGLYRTLYENNGQVIVFDDCDSVLRDPVSLNLLKGALDSYSKRIISWRADLRDDDLPQAFEFTGRVVFISNLSMQNLDQAIRSRSMTIDLSMTTTEKIDRMEYIVKSGEFMPEYDIKVKTDAINFIREIADNVKELSLRSLIKVCKIRAGNKEWRDLAEYMLTN
jgi:hypothetical protein